MEAKSKLSLISILCLVFLFKALFIPELVKATEIGTHLGEGDINTQVNIMDMLHNNGAGKGFPVTLMIDGRGRWEDIQESIDKLAAAVQKHGFAPIARINNSCDISSDRAINLVNYIKLAFGPEVIITYGNEVNNPRECPSESTFKNNYLALIGTHDKLSPSALDFYNQEHPATTFLSRNALQEAYETAPVRTANAYGCTDTTDINQCDIASTNTQSTGMQIIGHGEQIDPSKLYLTEFSLNPHGGSRAPDSDLNMVAAFIESRGPETNAVYITPLIRNVCRNWLDEGRWLLYLNGRFFTTHGNQVTMENCVPLDLSPGDYDLTGTHFKDPEDYNFFPLINPDSLDDAAGGSLRDRFLESLAKDQGYEVHCAAPQWYISSTEHRFDMAERYFELVVPNWGSQHAGPPAENVIEFTGQGEYIINLANSKVPLYRGQEATQYTQKVSSYEGFFGTVDNLHPYFTADGISDGEDFRPLESENNPVIYTGTAENLLSSFQQCKYKMGNLETVDYICQRVAGECYLDTIIPNTNYRRWQLRGELFDLMNNCGFEKCLDCADLTGPYDEEKLSHLLDEDKFYDLKHALANLSMDIDNLYRVAFLVIAPGQNKDLADTSGDWDRDFFYSHNAIEHHPMIIAFKIPDFLTNRSRFEYSAKPTADSVRSETQQEISLQKIDERRDGIYKEAKEMARKADEAGQNAEFAKEFMQEAVIYCPSLGICLDSDDPDTALKSAVISIINGAGSKSCPGGMPWEDAGDIYTLGRLSVEGDRQFDQDHGAFSDALTRTQRTNFNWGLRIVEETWKDDFGRNFFNHFEEGNNQKIPVNAYIVAPLGVTQDEIYEALKFRFTPEQYELLVEGNYLVDADMEGVVPEYLPLKDVEFGIEEDRDMFNFIDFEDPQTRDVPLIDPDTGQPIRDYNGEIIMTTETYYPEKEFGRGMEEERPERLLIYGAKVGWMMRKIQESITTAVSPLHEYLQSCERVEDMLLGRCAGGDGSRQYGPPGDPWSGGGGTGRCEPINNPDNHCDVNRLKESLAQYIRNRRGLSPGDSLPISEAELTRRATQASIICNAESRGNPNAKNLACLGGGSVDYSVGLFQINLLAHVCPEYFNYTWEPPWCQILVSQDRVDQCVATVIEPERNKEEAWRISGAGSNWSAWATAKDEHCGPDLRAVP